MDAGPPGPASVYMQNIINLLPKCFDKKGHCPHCSGKPKPTRHKDFVYSPTCKSYLIVIIRQQVPDCNAYGKLLVGRVG